MPSKALPSLRSILVLGGVAFPWILLNSPGWLLSHAAAQVVERRVCQLSAASVNRPQVPADPDWTMIAGRGEVIKQPNFPRPGVMEQEVTSVAFSPDGRFLVSGSRFVSGRGSNDLRIGVPGGSRSVTGGVELWSNLSTPQWNGRVLYDSKREVTSVAFSPDGKLLAVGGNDKGFIGLWTQAQWNGGKVVASPKPQAQTNSQFQINALAFSPNSRLLASAGIRGRSGRGHAIQRWDVRGGTLRTLNTPMENVGAPTSRDLVEDQEVYAIGFSPDSRIIAGGGLSSLLQRQGTVFTPVKAEPFLHLWNPETGKYLCSLANPDSAAISAVAFSPDGSILVTGNTSGTIRLWNLSNGELLTTLNQHQRRVTAIAFSPSGELLLSGSTDRTVKLWQVRTGRVIQNLQEHTDEVTSVAFRPDGQAFVTGSKDNTIQLFVLKGD
jgi:WD40 repeat protein